MPQLDLFAFVSELFWLLIFFGLFFYVVLIRVLPNIYYVLKLRNRFHKLGSQSMDSDQVTTSELNIKLEEVGGYTIKLYDLTMRRLFEFRDITTTKLYQVLFFDYIFLSFYLFQRIWKYLDTVIEERALKPIKRYKFLPKPRRRKWF